MQEVVVGRREAVDQVQRQAAQESGQCVLDNPPCLVGEERWGKCTRYEARVVGGQDRVEEDLLEPHVKVRLGDGHLHADELGRGVDPSRGSQVGPIGAELVFVNFQADLVLDCFHFEMMGCLNFEHCHYLRNLVLFLITA